LSGTDLQFGRGGADSGVLEVLEQKPQTIRRKRLPHIGEHKNLARSSCDPFGQRCTFAFSKGVDDRERVGVSRKNGCGIIGRPIVNHNDGDEMPWVVERKDGIKLAPQKWCAIMRGHDDRHRRKAGTAPDGLRTNARQNRE
jgi:hypothetical protein